MSAEEHYQTLVQLYHPQRVGRRIRQIRDAWELNQSEMARRLEVKPNTISQFESGRSRPSVDIELRIKAVFGVTADWLRFGEKDGLSVQISRRLDQVDSKSSESFVELPQDNRVDGKMLSRPARITKRN